MITIESLEQLDAAVRRATLAGLDAQAKDTLLLDAAGRHQHDIAKALIESGANVNAVGDAEWVPLEVAAYKGDLNMLNLLVEHGANPDGNPGKHRQYCPLARAVSAGDGSASVSDVLPPAMVRRLLDAGARVDDPDAWLMGVAARKASLAVFQLLLERATNLVDVPVNVVRTVTGGGGRDEAARKMRLVLDRKVEAGDALIELASAEGDGELVFELGEMLLDHGADLRTTTQSGATPLHIATQHGQLLLAELLIERGAEPDRKCEKADFRYEIKRGMTPRKIAEEKGDEMAELFARVPKTKAKAKAKKA